MRYPGYRLPDPDRQGPRLCRWGRHWRVGRAGPILPACRPAISLPDGTALPPCACPRSPSIGGYALGRRVRGGDDVRYGLIASDKAKFGQPEIKIGCIPGIGGTQRLTRLDRAGVRAMDMILTGRMIDAHEALQIGLVSRMVPSDDLADIAMETAQMIAGYAPDITQMARSCVNMAEQSTLDTGIRHERQTYHALYGLPAQKEGMAAFLEKRSPKFHPD